MLLAPNAVVIQKGAQNRGPLRLDHGAAELLPGCAAASGEAESSADLDFLEFSKQVLCSQATSEVLSRNEAGMSGRQSTFFGEKIHTFG